MPALQPLVLVSAAAVLLLGCCVVLAVALGRARRALARGAASAGDGEGGPGMYLNVFPDPFFIIDAEGVVELANEAAARLCGPLDPRGRGIVEALGDARLAAPCLECRRSGAAVSRRVLLTPEAASGRGAAGGAGEELWLVDAAPVAGGGGPARIRLLLRDLSAGHRADQVRKDFVANASHELRTPITLVDGYLETFLESPEVLDDRATALRYLGIMRRHTDRIVRIIGDMLLISRIEEGAGAALNLEDFALRECVEDIVERLDPLIRGQRAQVRVELHDPAATVRGDRFYWAQILFNLLENALKQNPRPGLGVVIRSEALAWGLRLEVIDDGIGIPAADLPFIFNRFYRVEKHHSQSQVKGTGLGLSIVKRAVEAHGGAITCESAPGIRTRFRIEFPGAGAAAGAGREVSSGQVTPGPSPGGSCV